MGFNLDRKYFIIIILITIIIIHLEMKNYFIFLQFMCFNTYPYYLLVLLKINSINFNQQIDQFNTLIIITILIIIAINFILKYSFLNQNQNYHYINYLNS